MSAITAPTAARGGGSEGGQDGPPPHDSGEGGAPDRTVVVGYGFWIFILSDIIMFAALFAAFSVLSGSTAGGPAARQLLSLTSAKYETAVLLTSSFTCGLAALALGRGATGQMQVWLVATLVLGATFLVLELSEFGDLIAEGTGPDRNASLSSFFGLVGCHGAHVAFGLLWLILLMAHFAAKGCRPELVRRLLCFSIFWHALDIVWVAILTNVYLMGAGR
ncbi:cytochrome (ubi)quinol oxidase subunit III [Sphingomonas sp. BK580]|uniref:cytochrome (ubi)quinol oxidase subunit III n=1 Tax=Sphingomonas sp. BK580 TaxID=2586972 RepID=UPI0016170760|nr:cytochrome (ubi)quinol oxidase subunit III [Sphingomonas sp. BK580]MBB3695215.1 cytochrome o ubiquinol oxidase subunit 3 [Sphingomonas sp. BK580]